MYYDKYTGQYIRGQWKSGSQKTALKVTDPYTHEVLTEISLATPQDLDDAYQAAAQAQPEWATKSASERAQILINVTQVMDQRHDEIVDILIRESGSTRMKAEMEFAATRACTFAAAMLSHQVTGKIIQGDTPDKESRVYRTAKGVIGIISPWNWPLHLSNRSIAPALALGNAVVVKPAEDTPITGGLLLASIYEEAGLPAGILNVVVGQSSEIGDAFTLHEIPKLISFTGSTRVGRHIGQLAMTGPSLKHVGLELGGNAPCVILDDADFEHAVNAAVVGRFLHQGQICMSTNRIIVEQSLYPRFCEAFIEKAKTLKVGDPQEADTVIGPLINRKQVQAATQRIQNAIAAGHHLALAGKINEQVVSPHVFVNVDNQSELAQTEQFAPIAPLICAQDEAHALALANQTEYGLASAVFTENEARGLRFAKQVHAGMTHINDITPNDDPYVMFGGEKNSGLGRFNADWMISEFTTDHWISVQLKKRSYPF
ncbi:aldehyde dehydrogenase (NAD+) [Acinetobacter baylyi]|uniref:Aldehyde dehydrogenase (NAD+) n=1 Tax=Acinetobacter baylyi TaxID=202950 RepID=A0ABU0UXP8_ACIBI|nr:aldehyde dehydrogenase family protein [Acinetobacter baylyi]MDQ1209331.1 aldehyde dehydrogenase (NAD+) [Acinetobacter baylyi]MDR6107076.1 aldehyde dehydrogenase (NAD+) [Acinetobacter baylyi]MDR6186203.1 aldehyde dehydrogenase (NAD+) [Acinetobacter baylyi]